MTSPPSFKNLAGKLSNPVALLAVSPFNRFSISSSPTVENETNFLQHLFPGNRLLKIVWRNVLVFQVVC